MIDSFLQMQKQLHTLGNMNIVILVVNICDRARENVP